MKTKTKQTIKEIFAVLAIMLAITIFCTVLSILTNSWYDKFTEKSNPDKELLLKMNNAIKELDSSLLFLNTKYDSILKIESFKLKRNNDLKPNTVRHITINTDNVIIEPLEGIDLKED